MLKFLEIRSFVQLVSRNQAVVLLKQSYCGFSIVMLRRIDSNVKMR